MAIPKEEKESYMAWINSLNRVPKDKCLIHPDEGCTRPDIRKKFMGNDIPVFKRKLNDKELIHVVSRPRICPKCPVSAKVIWERFGTIPRVKNY